MGSLLIRLASFYGGEEEQEQEEEESEISQHAKNPDVFLHMIIRLNA